MAKKQQRRLIITYLLYPHGHEFVVQGKSDPGFTANNTCTTLSTEDLPSPFWHQITIKQAICYNVYTNSSPWILN